MWRRRFLLVAVALSAVLFIVILVLWTGVTSRACLGWNRVAESSPDSVVVDNYTLLSGREGLWIGKCRISMVKLFSKKQLDAIKEANEAAGLGRVGPEYKAKDFRDVAEVIREKTLNYDVFSIEGLSPPLNGFGHQSGEVTDPTVRGALLRFKLNGVLLPYWVLLLVTGAGPALWAVGRIRRVWRSRVAAQHTTPHPADVPPLS
jgi:hypothetical protein